jgi:hypothetical protein
MNSCCQKPAYLLETQYSEIETVLVRFRRLAGASP